MIFFSSSVASSVLLAVASGVGIGICGTKKIPFFLFYPLLWLLAVVTHTSAVGAQSHWMVWRKRRSFPNEPCCEMGMCVCVVGGVLALCLIKAGMICSMESHQPSHGSLSASLVVQVVKNLSAMQETRVQSLGQEDPLENRMATHLVFLLGEFHGKTNLVGYSSWGCRVRRDWGTKTFTTTPL